MHVENTAKAIFPSVFHIYTCMHKHTQNPVWRHIICVTIFYSACNLIGQSNKKRSCHVFAFAVSVLCKPESNHVHLIAETMNMM